MSMSKISSGPLSGIRVVDFTHVWQGPVGTQLLGDLGADVIKVERPGSGDWTRRWGPYANGVSMPFVGLNRNKRSIAVDVKTEAGISVVHELIKNADVVVHNFRPGAMERLGLGYDSARALNPRIIYASSSGWGDRGPYVDRKKAGHDVLLRAATGWFVKLSKDAYPVPAGLSLDYPAGLVLVIGILSALQARVTSGVGQEVTTDLFSVGCHANTWKASQEMNPDILDQDDGVGATEEIINNSFRTKDGFIEISPVFSDNFLRDISVAMDLGDLSLDPRFHKMDDRVKNAKELNEILDRRFTDMSTDQWIEKLEPKGILCGHINTFKEAIADPQADENHMVVTMDVPHIGETKMLGTPLRFSSTPPTYRNPPPLLGGQTMEILKELGYSTEVIEEMLTNGVVFNGNEGDVR